MQEFKLNDKPHINDIPIWLKTEYGIAVDKLRSEGEGKFRADFEDGILNVESLDCRETRIIYTTGLYNHIAEKGFKKTLRILRALTGKYYAARDGKINIVYLVPSDSESILSLSNNADALFELLSSFHGTSRNYISPPGGKAKSDWGRWIEEYKKDCRFLKDCRDSINKKVCRTYFEGLFMKCVGKYIDSAEKSILILKDGAYLKKVEESMRNRQVCLSSFKQSNFCRTGEDIIIKSLFKCSCDICEHDVAKLAEKILICDPDYRLNRLRSLIETYSCENELCGNGINIIRAFLMFPGEYIKVSSKYFGGKRKRTEDEYASELVESERLQDMKIELAESLY